MTRDEMTGMDEVPDPHAGVADASRNPVPALRGADLDRALAHWAPAPLPAGFVASTMARVRAQPRFRLSPADAVVALAAALVGSGAIAWTTSLGRLPEAPAWRSAMLAAARVWLAVRPADPRLTVTVVAAVGLTVAAVAMASWIGRTPRGWSVQGR